MTSLLQLCDCNARASKSARLRARRSAWARFGAARFGAASIALLVCLNASAWSSAEPFGPADLGSAAQRGAVATAIATLTTDRDFFAKRGAGASVSWVDLERAAANELTLARLTGDLDAYDRAQAMLTAAFDAAPSGSGPFATRAQLHLTLHRLDAAEADLRQARKRLLLSDRERAGLLGLQGDIAFQRGHYAEALTLWSDAESALPTAGSKARLAQYAWKTGHPDQALQLLADAQVRAKSEGEVTQAWVALQSAMVSMDRSRLGDATQHLDAAAAALPGWYLVDEHRAEILTLTGKWTEARAAYEEVLRRVPRAEFMAALAGVWDKLGSASESEGWMARAEAAYEAELARFPEAAGAHALEFFLERKGAGARALTLAREAARLSPYGESQVLLARGLLGQGLVEEAAEVLAGVWKSPWRTADFHETAAEVHDALALRASHTAQ